MTKVSGLSPNLINGVSQQAPALRLPSQHEIQDNAYSTIVEGLKKAPPTEFVTKIPGSVPDNAFTHTINRDLNERYEVVVTPTGIQIYDFDGNAKVVNTPNGIDYLSCADPKTQLRAITIADYTFFVNTTKTVKAGTATFPTRPHEAMINILTGQPSRTYRVYINGAIAADWRVGNRNGSDQDTSYIAAVLCNSGSLPTNPDPEASTTASTSDPGAGTGLINRGFTGPNGWGINQFHNSIYITRDTDFTISGNDGYNNQAMKVIKDVVQNFTDLPNYTKDGVTIEVKGDSKSNANTSYWVQYVATDGSAGYWKEVPKPGMVKGLDASTMPHVLVRNADGTFTFKQAEWDERKCGDEKSSPDPSFVNKKINDIFFHRNRLGFLADENTILSRSGSFFDFYRTTATALLDDDPIDVGASHVKVSILKGAIPYQDYLFLFSDQTQFRLAGNDTLTPKTVSIKPMTEYLTAGGVRPVGLGQLVFFGFDRGEYSGVRDFTINKYNQMAESTEITEHVPTYIPSPMRKLIGSSNENFLAALTDSDPSTLYVYKFYYSKDDKIQAAWQRWDLGSGVKILDASIVDTWVYLVVKRGDTTYIERINIQPNFTDEEVGFLVNLDQKVSTVDLPAPVYNATADITTFRLPYTVNKAIKAVTKTDSAKAKKATELKIKAASGQTVVLSGDWRDVPMWFGFTRPMLIRLSRIYRKQQSQNGSLSVEQGRLQIHRIGLTFDRTSYFKVTVTNEGRDPEVTVYNGRRVDYPMNLVDEVHPNAGRLSIPVYGRSDRITIDITSDSWLPVSLISMQWEGEWTPQQKFQ